MHVNLQDVVAVSCSWCGDSYHTSCFSPRLKEEPCHMGPLRRLIIKSSWIVRVPNLDRVCTVHHVHLYTLTSGQDKISLELHVNVHVHVNYVDIFTCSLHGNVLLSTFHAASQGDESPKPFSVTRRKTRRSRRKKLESRPSKYFKVLFSVSTVVSPSFRKYVGGGGTT